MQSPVSPEAVMALTLLQADKPLEIKDISARFLEIRQKNLPVGKVALRRIVGGVYSEDVEAFIGRLLAARYVNARSPIVVLPEAVRICKEILEDELRERRESLETVARELKMDIGAAIAQKPELQRS